MNNGRQDTPPVAASTNGAQVKKKKACAINRFNQTPLFSDFVKNLHTPCQSTATNWSESGARSCDLVGGNCDSVQRNQCASREALWRRRQAYSGCWRRTMHADELRGLAQSLAVCCTCRCRRHTAHKQIASCATKPVKN